MFQSTRNRIISILVLCTLVITGSVIFFSQNSSKNPSTPQSKVERTKIKVGYLGVAQALTSFVAQEKNYFKDQNLEAELVKFESPALIQDAIISGNIDIASTAGTGIAAIAFSKDSNQFKIFNTSYASKDYPSDVLVAGKDVEANSLADLKGKTVGVVPGPQFKTVFSFMAKQVGLNPSEVGGSGDIFYRELAVPEQIGALKSGQIQAILGLDPIGTIADSTGAGKKIGVSPISTALGFKFYGSSGLINQKFAKENPQTTEKIIKAFDQAIDDTQQNPNAQRQYLEKYLGIKEPVLSKVALPANKKLDQLKDQDIEEIQKLINLFQDQGILKTKVDVKDMIYKG